MKKFLIFSILLITSISFNVFATERVTIYATVWWNPLPILSEVNPASNPIFMPKDSLQLFRVLVDFRWETFPDWVNYTITASNWSVSVNNWNLINEWYITFYYRSPSISWSPVLYNNEITIALTTGTWIVSRSISVYVY